MATSLFITGFLVSLLILGIFARTIFTRNRDLMSYRTFFLLGFVYFISNSTMLIATNDPRNSPLGNYTPSGEGYLRMCIAMVMFVAVYMLADKAGSRMGALTKLIPEPKVTPSAPAILTTISISLVIALIASLAGGAAVTGGAGQGVGYTGAVLIQLRGSFVAIAMGLATYYLLCRRVNPLAWFVFFGVLAIGAPITLALSGGRRSFLTMIIAIGWAWYYFTLRYGDFKVLIVKAAIPAAAAFVLLVTWSSIRHQEASATATIGVRFQQLTTVVTNPLAGLGYTMQTLIQDAPVNVIFIMENYPTNYDIPWWHGIVYFVTNPIPRAIFPAKPEGLGELIQDQMDAAANLGPGILGHGWAESGYAGIIGYALFFGFLIAVVDRAISQRALNPFFVVIMAGSMAEVLALPRGDTPLFLANIVAATLLSMAIIFGLNLVFGPVWKSFEPLETAEMRRYRASLLPPEHETATIVWDADAQSADPALSLQPETPAQPALTRKSERRADDRSIERAGPRWE